MGKYIQDEALKLVARFHRYESAQRDEARRMTRRRGVQVSPVILRPSHWRADRGFDPFYVATHVRGIAYAIDKALEGDDYMPRPAVRYGVPKSDGNTRWVSTFQVADNAVSRLVFQRLTKKNAPRLSPRCYAYRADVTRHDAVAYISEELRNRSRIFVAEFDFKSFFDSVSHDQVERILRDRHFVISEREKRIIRAFIHTPDLEAAAYDPDTSQTRARGIPLGTSISLFLANAVAFPLDQKLERLGVGFARYADDTVIWGNSYGEICRAMDALAETAAQIGVTLNYTKSDGISVLSEPGERSEIRGKSAVEFVGYSVSKRSIGLRRNTITRVKRNLSLIVYRNLVQEPKAGNIVPARFAPDLDRDYLVMVRQIRRHLYGNVSESWLRRYLARTIPAIRYKGLMSFYPLIDDEQLLRSLDGWLLHTVFHALRERTNLLLAAGYRQLPVPHMRPKRALLQAWGRTAAGVPVDLRLPSFSRIGKLLREAAREHGASSVSNALSNRYYP